MLKKVLSVIGAYKLYEKWLWYQVKNGERLEHIAIILDGNRRWANENELNPWLGHKKGAETVEQLLDWCEELNVKFITLYTFSTENFRRKPDEIDEIMKITEEKFRKLITDERIHKNKVHVKVIGRTNLLPESLQQLIADVEKATAHYDNQFLNFAIAYGGRAEIVDAARAIAEKVKAGEMEPQDIQESLLKKSSHIAYSKQEPICLLELRVRSGLAVFCFGNQPIANWFFWMFTGQISALLICFVA